MFGLVCATWYSFNLILTDSGPYGNVSAGHRPRVLPSGAVAGYAQNASRGRLWQDPSCPGCGDYAPDCGSVRSGVDSFVISHCKAMSFVVLLFP